MDDVNFGGEQARAAWMAVLARASRAELLAALGTIPMPEVEIVKPAETGLVMLEGRAGGGGRRFNAGEATMTRCIVRLGDTLGHSYALGRDKEKAVICATLDALLQDAAHRDGILLDVITPLATAQASRKAAASRRAAATKVDFHTMVRGEG